MTISVLVHIEPTDASRTRLELAARLAQRLDAVLIGVAAGQPMPPVVDAYDGVPLAADIEAEDERVRTELKDSATAFSNCSAVSGLQTEWRSAIGLPAEVVVRESRAADMIILGRDPDRLGIYRSADPGDVLMRAGRPVLVVPAGTSSLAAKHVIVSWKDTREARRACHDALPLLQAADRVFVIEVVDEPEIAAAKGRVADVVAFLGCHGVNAKAESRLSSERSIADQLIGMAQDRGADLIVAGAYGHTRLRE
jgi:nucleotide-binding universal stress UspA family protein